MNFPPAGFNLTHFVPSLQILQLQMNDFRYHYMFTTFVSHMIESRHFVPRNDFIHLQDIETFDLEDFKYNSVNITAFRLVDVENPNASETMEQMKKFQHSGKDASNGSSVIMVKFIN